MVYKINGIVFDECSNHEGCVDDESYAGGLWDMAAELIVTANQYSIEEAQEIIYNELKELIAKAEIIER